VPYLAFEREVLKRFQALNCRRADFDLVHRVTPMSPDAAVADREVGPGPCRS
jgi:hypothetical protein